LPSRVKASPGYRLPGSDGHPVGEWPLRSLVIGQGTLPVQCAAILLRDGHRILATCSPDSPLRDLANTNHILHYPDVKSFSDFASSETFDYLFSITNYSVLPAGLLKLPLRMPINYHDAPLPRYAGVYATTWAILNDETIHGITWHVMTEKVDAGDILKQVPVPVKETDTAGDLNLKCYFAAVRTFSALAGEIRKGTVTRTPQDLNNRTYFGFQNGTIRIA